jgi:hypothetical protein
MEMLLMFSCSNDNATKWPITGSCEKKYISIRHNACDISCLLYIIIIYSHILYFRPVPMAVWSEAHTVFSCLNSGITGSNPAQGMDACPHFFCVVLSCVGRGLASG